MYLCFSLFYIFYTFSCKTHKRHMQVCTLCEVYTWSVKLNVDRDNAIRPDQIRRKSSLIGSGSDRMVSAYLKLYTAEFFLQRIGFGVKRWRQVIADSFRTSSKLHGQRVTMRCKPAFCTPREAWFSWNYLEAIACLLFVLTSAVPLLL